MKEEMMDQNELTLRRLLWLVHGHCDFAALYGDDGEMQCNSCMIDFKRDTPERIEARLMELAITKFSTGEPSINTAVIPDDLYQPICKFCGQKVDEMVTVHFKSGDQRMCVECAKRPLNRTKTHKFKSSGYFGVDYCCFCGRTEDKHIK